MFIAVLIIIAKYGISPSINEWIKENVAYKEWSTYYPDIKKNEILSFAGKWMELKSSC
jgi:hypothetical protein